MDEVIKDASDSGMPEAAFLKKGTRYRNPAYNIVSTMAYLVGVPIEYYIFDDGTTREQAVAYQKLEQNKNARIIRNLSIVRTNLEKFYAPIRKAFGTDFKNIGSVPEYISPEVLRELDADGVELYRSKPDINEYLFDINKEMGNRINSVKNLFPEWLNWGYIRDLFIMPKGHKLEGLKAAGAAYNRDRSQYPFQCYINWERGNHGNILYNDEKFVTLLYEAHHDRFEDLSLVRDASNETFNNIYEFLQSSTKTLIVVDCENSDPVKLAACLSGLSPQLFSKIHNVLLVDSDYTTTGWGILSRNTNLPLDRVKIPRLVEHKSQVDMALAVRTCREVYQNGVDSVVLVSSDSDYWALIQTLSDVEFMVMAERNKCGAMLKEALGKGDVPYCFIDDFCTHASYSIKTAAMTDWIQNELDRLVQVNARSLLCESLKGTWMSMSDKEKDGFYNRYLKTMRVQISEDGSVRLVLGE